MDCIHKCKTQTTKLEEKNIRENCDPGLGKNLLTVVPKAPFIKQQQHTN